MALPARQYLPEKTEVEPLAVEPEETLSSRDTPLSMKQVDIDQRIYSVDTLISMLSREPSRIDLGTGFQRSTNLWTSIQQSRLIESMLIRIPIPVFYFDATDEDRWLVIDGLQRLGTLKNFIIDKTLILSGMEFLPQFEGHKYDDLPIDIQRRLKETVVTAFVINPGTDPDVKFIIFHRINTGGISLTAQEIRHALYNGQPAEFVGKLSEFDEFKQATGYAINPNRMLDREFATRFLSFYLLDPENYHPDMESFMNNGMRAVYSLTPQQLLMIETDFKKSMRSAFEIFGGGAFRKWYSKEEPRKPLNKSLFDVWSYTLAKLPDNQIAVLIHNKKSLLLKYFNILQTNEEFNLAISNSTGDKYRVWSRFRIIDKLVKETLIYDL